MVKYYACIFLLLFIASGCTKTPSEKPSEKPTGKSAGGISFESVGDRAGLTFRYPKQPRPMRNLEAFGTGCAFLDYDDDGWQDILLVAAPHAVLYRNKHDGTFEDVTTPIGLDKITGDWKGCAVGDYDNDGKLDLLLTGYHCLALLKNENGKRFNNQTVANGFSSINRGHWGASAGFMDLDGDGNLDLVLQNYVIMGPSEKQYCELRSGVKSGCPPSEYKPEFPEMWHNLGGGNWEEKTTSAGLNKTNGKGLVVAFYDGDNDGKPDFYLGNDGTAAALMHNQGGFHFENQALMQGVAYGNTGRTMAAMGADWADYDRDGKLDLAVSGFSDEVYMVYHALQSDLFEPVSDTLRLNGPTLKPLGFGTKWLDMDNDGWPDLIFANGHVYDNTNEVDPRTTFLQPIMLFHNQRGEYLEDIVPTLGGEIARPLLGRGSATGDFDNDGKGDFLVVDYEGMPRLYHNISQTPNHYLTLDLRQKDKNRFVYGASVTATAGTEQWTGYVSPTSSYLSSSDPRIHWGLGATTTLETLTIRWPDGKVETRHNVPADQILRITHP
jgi:enediyne biosynthesis protein E4